MDIRNQDPDAVERALAERLRSEADASLPEFDEALFERIRTKLASGDPPSPSRQEVVILGRAGQRIITAGEILCMAGLFAGLNVTQKNDYNITVLRGPAVSEVILACDKIDFTGIDRPNVVLALSREGVESRKHLFKHLDEDAVVIKTHDVEIPACRARVHEADFKAQGIKNRDRALAALAILAGHKLAIHRDMLYAALSLKFKDGILTAALDLVKRAAFSKG